MDDHPRRVVGQQIPSRDTQEASQPDSNAQTRRAEVRSLVQSLPFDSTVPVTFPTALKLTLSPGRLCDC
jgi:hypothetical protein